MELSSAATKRNSIGRVVEKSPSTMNFRMRTSASFVDSTGKSDWGALFAMSVVTLLPVFAFFLFFQRLLIEGIATTGLRG